MTTTAPAPTTDVETQHDNPAKKHIIKGGLDATAAGYIGGQPIEALCGKVFVPTRNPADCVACEPCWEVLELYAIKDGVEPGELIEGGNA